MGVAELTNNDARVPMILTGSSRARRSTQVDLQFSNRKAQPQISLKENEEK